MIARGSSVLPVRRLLSQVNDEDIDALMEELAQIRTGTGGAVADAARREVAAADCLEAGRIQGRAPGTCRACTSIGQAVALNFLQRPAQLVAALKIDAAAALNESLDDLELAVVGDGLALAGAARKAAGRLAAPDENGVAPFTLAWRPRNDKWRARAARASSFSAGAPPLAEVRANGVVAADDSMAN